MGTIRRECLDYMIPLSEKHLRKVLREWVSHYNRGRPHATWAKLFHQQLRVLPVRVESLQFRPTGTGP